MKQSSITYRKRPVIVHAYQWFKNGDHPQDGPPEQEGKVVQHFRSITQGVRKCAECGHPFNGHGSIKTLEGSYIVCPGDWIITGIKGEHYPCKPDIFAATYDSVL